MIRLFASARSSRWTSIGTSVLDALSANVSAVPSRNMATSTSQIVATSTATAVASSTRTRVRTESTTMTSRRRSSRSVTAPAHSPNSSGGSHWSSAASATRNASSVRDATSSGPAASTIPSPRFVLHDEASSHRNPVPSRRGTTVSTIRLTTAGR